VVGRGDLGKVLEYVNEVRDQYGLPGRLAELRRGEIGSAHSCPIATSLDREFAFVGSYLRHDKDREVITCPDFMERFQRDFDGGAYPELVSE